MSRANLLAFRRQDLSSLNTSLTTGAFLDRLEFVQRSRAVFCFQPKKAPLAKVHAA